MPLRGLDHVDLRVPRLEAVEAFYRAVLPALGFGRELQVAGWLQFEAEDGALPQFFGVTEAGEHRPNETRLAFRCRSRAEVEAVTTLAEATGARELEGPLEYAPGYYASFFTDPAGNRLEVCYRTARTA